MAAPAIRVENVGKRYDLGKLHVRENRLAESLQRSLTAPFRALRPAREPSHLKAAKRGGELWALRDVSMEVFEGEIVGLIGPNGAGKSTLLKLISAITPPTEGRITVWGRTATLLEVGTGFHPELTGRENVFINGAILGLRRHEIESKFNEIVEFSGVGPFIDTPVKRYSSGMFVRLAFAVAAHLDPEILIVDEVLAVGDAEFQRKCLGKMHEASELGRTVVFVSHNLESVQRLCDRAYLIDNGGLVAEGTPAEAVAEYMSRSGPTQGGGVAVIPRDAERIGATDDAKLTRVALSDSEGHRTDSVHLGEPFRVALQIEARREIQGAVIEVGIATPDRQRVATVTSIDRPGQQITLMAGLNEIEVGIEVSLLPAEYILDIAIHHGFGELTDRVVSAFRFKALNTPVEGQDAWPWPEVRGYVRPTSVWSGARQVHAPALRVPTDDSGAISS